MLNKTIQELVVGIPEKEVKIIQQWVVKEKHAEVINLRIQRRNKTAICLLCRKRTSKRQDRQIYRKWHVKHLFTTGGKEIRLHLEKRRFRHCGKSFVEKYSFETNGQYTKAFQDYILQEWKHLSVLEMARRTDVSDWKLWNIIKQIDTKELADEGIQFLEKLDEIHLGLDGHSFRGKDMVMVITELKQRKVVAVLPAETNDCVKVWLDGLPPKVLAKIKTFVIDMKIGIKHTIKQTLGGNVVEIVDHYHLVQEANRMVDEMRRLGNWFRREFKRELRTIVRKAKFEDKAMLKKVFHDGVIESYVEIGHRRIFLKGAERLTPHQQSLVISLLRRCPYLREAWLEKELLREALNTQDPVILEKVKNDCIKSEQYRIRQFGRTLKRWFVAILNFFQFKLTNAFTEGKNNKAKVFKRIAYGYRNKSSYIRKLYFAL